MDFYFPAVNLLSFRDLNTISYLLIGYHLSSNDWLTFPKSFHLETVTLCQLPTVSGHYNLTFYHRIKGSKKQT